MDPTIDGSTRRDNIFYIIFYGSTDRCCIAIVTNERALLSESDQPVQNKIF